MQGRARDAHPLRSLLLVQVLKVHEAQRFQLFGQQADAPQAVQRHTGRFVDQRTRWQGECATLARARHRRLVRSVVAAAATTAFTATVRWLAFLLAACQVDDLNAGRGRQLLQFGPTHVRDVDAQFGPSEAMIRNRG
ncbi:MAG: hypothetical protein HZY76_15455 [Anaerolineae bacterium]|nr:MAG: hypothetical protein HZY76_15455 [Anaerolineae bacterium]